MGLEVPGPGSLVRQTMLSVDDQLAGRPFASPTPDPPGPRNCNQSAAPAREAANAARTRRVQRFIGGSFRTGGSRSLRMRCRIYYAGASGRARFGPGPVSGQLPILILFSLDK